MYSSFVWSTIDEVVIIEKWILLIVWFFSSLHSRVQPLHMFIMCLTIGLISVIQWGPYWFPLIETMMDCKTYWWANILLISNLLPVHEIVSLSTAMQLPVYFWRYVFWSTVFLLILFPFLSPVYPLDMVLVSWFPVLCHHPTVTVFLQIVRLSNIILLLLLLFSTISELLCCKRSESHSSILSGVYQEQRCVCSGGSGPVVDDHCCWCSYNCTHAPTSPSASCNVRLSDNLRDK